MYKITKEIADYLMHNVKEPGIKKDSPNPFDINHTHCIGLIDPLGCFGSEFDYSIEMDLPFEEPGVHYKPEVEGFFLYRRDELKPSEEAIKIHRQPFDPAVQNPEEMIDVTDCSIQVAEAVDKLTCRRPPTIEKLLEWEPDLKKCLRDSGDKKLKP